MKEKKLLKRTIVIMLLIALVMFKAEEIEFYMFNTNPDSYSFSIKKNSKSNTNGQMVWFEYDDNEIILNVNLLIDNNIINMYSLKNDNSVDKVTCDKFKTSNAQSGSYIASVPKILLDVNNDGNDENVKLYAKTDCVCTQGFRVVNTLFSDENIPFELRLVQRNKIAAYFDGKVLNNKEITINTVNKEQWKVNTDENGFIDIPLNEIRAGINATYVDENNTYYIMSYQVEDNTLFTTRHKSALMPLAYILSASAAIIFLVAFIRNRNGILVGYKDFRFKDTIVSLWDIIAGFFERITSFKLNYMGIRWIIMIAFFIVITYGSRIFGGWVSHVYIPMLTCPQNQDQALGCSCYEISHLSFLLEKYTGMNLVFFILSFVVSIVLLGRAICGFLCPFGLLQDVVYELRQLLGVRGMSFNERVYNILKLVKWEILLFCLGGFVVGIDFCKICPAFVMSPAFAGFKLSVYASGVIAIVVIVLGFFKRRLWCNVCPFGYLIGLFHKVSLFRLKKNCQSCTECGACYEACPMGIKSIYTEREKEDITTTNCIMCGECVKKCPENDAIAISFAKKKIYTASRFKFFKK